MQCMGPVLWSIQTPSDDRLLPPLHLQRLKQFSGLSGPRLRGSDESCWRPEHMSAWRSAASWNDMWGALVRASQPRPATVCSAHPGMPAHTLRCGLELSQEHSVERLDERDRVYSANRRPTVCLLSCLSALSRTKYTAVSVCARVLCFCVFGLVIVWRGYSECFQTNLNAGVGGKIGKNLWKLSNFNIIHVNKSLLLVSCSIQHRVKVVSHSESALISVQQHATMLGAGWRVAWLRDAEEG